MEPKEQDTQQQTLPTPENAVESENPMRHSHMNKAMEHQARRNIIYAVVGIAVIIGLLATFGTFALQKLSDFALNTKEAKEDEKTVETSLLVPPLLETQNTATNSAEVTISGTVEDGDSVKLYVNNALAERMDLGDKKEFSFENVTLREGINRIKTKVVKGDKESADSEVIEIEYYEKAPELEISSPTEGQTFNGDQNPILVRGKTAPYARVTVNDRRAIMDSEGNYEYRLSLNGGDNDIKVIAEDSAGNKTEKHVKAILQ